MCTHPFIFYHPFNSYLMNCCKHLELLEDQILHYKKHVVKRKIVTRITYIKEE